MIDMRRLRELVKLMGENDLAELDLRDQQETVTIKRAVGGPPVVVSPPAAGQAQAPQAATADRDEDNGHAAGDSAAEGLVPIESPMVGTFYAASSPDADPFISVGDSVGQSSVVCIIEAMKVFNEIKADVAGTVERVLVENGDAVEYGQKLFLIRPN